MIRDDREIVQTPIERQSLGLAELQFGCCARTAQAVRPARELQRQIFGGISTLDNALSSSETGARVCVCAWPVSADELPPGSN